MIPSIVVGTYEGTGAALNVSLGFKPDFLLIANTEDSDVFAFRFRTIQAAGVAVDVAAAVAANVDNGLSDYAGSSTAGEGFSVGTDYSENGKTYGYVAMRSGPGAN